MITQIIAAAAALRAEVDEFTHDVEGNSMQNLPFLEQDIVALIDE